MIIDKFVKVEHGDTCINIEQIIAFKVSRDGLIVTLSDGIRYNLGYYNTAEKVLQYLSSQKIEFNEVNNEPNNR